MTAIMETANQNTEALRTLKLHIGMGLEGESAHDEGSLRRNAESLPEFLRRQLNPYRRGRAVEA